MSKNSELKVEADWGISENGILVRMEWTLINKSNQVFIVDGYRIEKGTLLELESKKDSLDSLCFSSEGNHFYQSNAHVSTILWPNESRTFIWAYVYPDYYNVDSSGRWGYFVIIRYRQESKRDFLYSMSDIAYLDMEFEKRKSSTRELYLRLEQEIRKLLELENLQEIKQMYTDYRISHIGIIDVLVKTNDAIQVIEFAKRFDKFKLTQILRYMEWFKVGEEKRIIGVLIVDNPIVDVEKPIILPPNTSLYITLLKDRSLKIIEFHSEKSLNLS